MRPASDALLRYAKHYMGELSDATNLYNSGDVEDRPRGLALFDAEWNNIRRARVLLIERSQEIASSLSLPESVTDRNDAMEEFAPIAVLIFKHEELLSLA